MNVLVVDDGTTLRGYDCRDVLNVEEIEAPIDMAENDRFLVHLGRAGCHREIRCREVVGFFPLSAREIRPVPPVLRERMTGEVPWAVGVTDRGLCLLF
ncbi:MAG: hypothetical protein M0Z38_01750 [Deltaproteobacteria bacterium]|nr:hypothetical protein [Deltaproteobacteria bacterium]